ncbi:hypothetical protein CLIM01_12079 [Colletotrichum limetticola]|uniref:Uncharacterized protein n=1 Tax=Colletotrichum limetticola TaxID=1209924 RepID=A0ABQ9PET8_9PEZI|nr:hypothetical protein CLIM01_12079 [Colletotrichum limetticola]
MRPSKTPATECAGFQSCHGKSQCFPPTPGTRPRGTRVKARAQCPNR